MKKSIITLVLLFLVPFITYAQTPKSTFTIGVVDTINSKVLSEKRIINIYLPEGYSPNDSTKYPVIYLLDGSKDEDFIHVAGLIQYLSFPWINQTPASIVVGIANVDRKRDFTFPTNVEKDKLATPTSGSSEKFISFIEKELQPYVQRNFKASTVRTLIGQSLGGLLATEILFKRSKLFDNYLIISPSLWWDKESLLSINPVFKGTSKINVHISVGEEGNVMVNDAKAFYQKMQGYKTEKVNSAFKYYGDMNHANVGHLALYSALIWLDSQIRPNSGGK